MTSTKILKKIESEKIFRNLENIIKKESDFFIRIVPPEKPASMEMEQSGNKENSLIQKCCICFDKMGDAVLMECGHGGNFFNFNLRIFQGICYDCSLKLWKRTGACFLCRLVL